MAYTKYFVSGHMKKWFEESICDENIMCVYESPFFNGKPDAPDSVILRLFPLGWLSPDMHCSRIRAQRSVGGGMN
jgi:hypothetical protein